MTACVDVMRDKDLRHHARRGCRGGGRAGARRSASCSGRTARGSSIRTARARSSRRCRRLSRRSACSSTSRSSTCNGVASLVRLGAVQLHGDETPAYAAGDRRAGDQGRRRSASATASARGRRAMTLLLDVHDPVGAAAPGGRSTGPRPRRSRRARRDRAGRRPDAGQRRPTRSRGCGRSASTCRRAWSARPASRITQRLRGAVRGGRMTPVHIAARS